jgi:hypothetical protein
MDRVATLAFAAVLRNEPVSWEAFGMTAAEFLDLCRAEGLTALVHRRAILFDEWPQTVRAGLADETRQHAAMEMVRQKELLDVLEALASADVRPLILKGTALAHTHYPDPVSRPRIDTDLLIPVHEVDTVRRALLDCGYAEPNFCGGDLFCQFPMHRTDRFGFVHKLDVHWKISTQPVFADVLCYEEMAARAVAVPGLGPHARTPAAVHALLLACIHPAMHHRNIESLLWQYDIHLLAESLRSAEWREFVELARSRRVASVCAYQLDATRRRLHTPVPELAGASLLGEEQSELSSAYLRADRRWLDDVVASLGGLRHWPQRLRFLRDVAFPPVTYMRRAYELPPSPLATILLPFVYAYRLAAGGWKVLAGEK